MSADLRPVLGLCLLERLERLLLLGSLSMAGIFHVDTRKSDLQVAYNLVYPCFSKRSLIFPTGVAKINHSGNLVGHSVDAIGQDNILWFGVTIDGRLPVGGLIEPFVGHSGVSSAGFAGLHDEAGREGVNGFRQAEDQPYKRLRYLGYAVRD